ncbi:MAG: hypothetical protein A3G18_11890 [Rhodospirillales bacterium RIFCSPLOWO2_12_FULL_58_28]|nr:MAG: hypothetical protein A3H92_12080 [Rhodospirillales bacterium RIFCSPLOWO2_02_FULL_58_16]OHC77513.1 MAG: hypothetical protein A3G18_11890 [Rhodospirillales bacterium RIFCSPLOWO2_12_FULL_58_28]
MSIKTRLKELGIDLPQAASPVANYAPYVKTGALIFISGQITIENGELKYLGRLGENINVEQGYQAAHLCAKNLIAQAEHACDGDLDRITRVVKLTGFVNCTPDFTDHPKVINGASDLMVEVFGPKIGPHARAAVGCASLPRGVSVEVDGLFEMR